MSGLAITAFVLSLVLGGVALFTGLWWLAALCAVLCGWAMMRALPSRFRGRGLAITGLVVSMLAGSCSYIGREAMFAFVDTEVARVLRVLDAGTLEAAERRDRLDALLHETARAKEQGAVLLERFARVEALMGEWKRSVSAGGLFSSHLPLIVGPPANFVRVDDPTEGPPALRQDMKVIWTVADFERGPVFVGLELAASVQDTLSEPSTTQSAPAEHIVDVLFFAEETRLAGPGASGGTPDAPTGK